MTSGRFTAILMGLVLLLGALSALDVVTPDVGERSDLATSEAARSGAWTCPFAGLAPAGTGHLVAAAPPGDSGIAADVTYDQFLSGNVARVARSNAFPEQAVADTAAGVRVEEDTSHLGLVARWRRQPAAVGRWYEVPGEQGPGGVLSAPCIAGTSSTWVVPGLSTAGGAEASLVLSNPFSSDASVLVTLATPEGPRQPVLLENIVVPAHSVRVLSLNSHAPEERDLGVIVTTRSGRVVVEAMQTVNAAIGGIEGITLVSAAMAGDDSWTVPWVAADPRDVDPLDADGLDLTDSDEDSSDELPESVMVVEADGIDGDPDSWIWVTNVGDDDAVLLLTLHSRDGSELVDTFDEPVLAPGAVRRIDLDGLLPPGSGRVSVTVATENGVPVVASVATQVADDDEDRTGLVVQLGAPASDVVWVVPGEAPQDRGSVLAIVNTGGEQATVALSFWTADGIVRPEDGQAIVVPAGALRLVDVADVLDLTRPDQVAFVRADTGAVIVGRVGWSPSDDLDLVAHLGVPSAVWSGGTLVPTTRFDPSLTGEVVRDDEG